MTVNIGLGIGSREANQMHLSAIKDMQAAIVQNGGMNLLVTPKNIYNTAAEFVKNANLKDPGLYFTDPGNKSAPPPSDEQQKLQAQQQSLMQYQQQLDAQAQQLKEQKVQLDHQIDMLKLQQQKDKNDDDLMVEVQKLKNEMLEIHLKYNTPEKPKTLKYNPQTGGIE